MRGKSSADLRGMQPGGSEQTEAVRQCAAEQQGSAPANGAPATDNGASKPTN
jgi:hypothetical protein